MFRVCIAFLTCLQHCLSPLCISLRSWGRKQPHSQETLLTLHLHLKDQLFIQSCANFVGLGTGLKPLRNHLSEPETARHQLTPLIPAV